MSMELQQVDPLRARAWQESGSAVLIDIRDPDEHAREHIPGSINIPVEALGPGEPCSERASIAVFYCAAGNRTREAREKLLDCGFAQTCELAGGMAGWRGAGLGTVVNRRAPLPLMRQVQIAAGSLILLGVMLGLLVDRWWLGLSAFVGAGLVFAGLSGWCGMALLLARMPWNRRGAGNGQGPGRAGDSEPGSGLKSPV